MKHKFFGIGSIIRIFLSMTKGSMERYIESLFLIVTKSSIFLYSRD
ncbi:hypothetical protein AAZX31_11G150100 [Glycine max]